MAAKFFTGLPLDGPDPECVLGHGEALLELRGAHPEVPRPSGRPLDPAPAGAARATRARWPDLRPGEA